MLIDEFRPVRQRIGGFDGSDHAVVHLRKQHSRTVVPQKRSDGYDLVTRKKTTEIQLPADRIHERDAPCRNPSASQRGKSGHGPVV